jgi:ADP-heptose:LPS heptosyltransferase
VPQALAVVAGARAFVGVDSALAHAAAIQGIPTVVPMPASTPGYFFPYPAALRRAPLRAVWASEFASCAGCGGICEREPLWTSRRRGFPCVRDLGVEPVAAALAQVLAQPPEPQRGDAAPAAVPAAWQPARARP